MTLEQIHYFRAVCKHGSITKASEAIHISQPTISIAIKNLEEEFGLYLFRREKKRLVLTQEGVFFYERISAITRELDALSHQMIEMGSNNGTLSLAIPSLAGHLFTHYINSFRAAHPETSVTVMQCNIVTSLKLMEQGAIDMAIVIDSGEIPSGYEQLSLLHSRFMYCVSKNNPLSSMDSIDFSCLACEPIILNEDHCYMNVQIRKRFFELGLVPNVALYATQLSLIKELLDSGTAGTFFSEDIAASWPDIKAIPIEPEFPLDYILVWKPKYSISQNIKKFAEHVNNFLVPQPHLMKFL